MAKRDLEIEEAMESNSTAITMYEDKLPKAAQSTVFSTSTDDFDEEDLMYPLVMLVQAQNPIAKQKKAAAGQYYMSGEVPQDSITFVPLTKGKDRLRVNQRNEKVCRSFDLIHGIGDPGTLCETCKYAKADWKNGIKPECNMRYQYIGFIPEFNTPARIIMKSSAMPTARQLNARIKIHGFGNFAVKLGSTTKYTNGIEYFIPTMEAPVGVDVDAVVRYAHSFMPEGTITVEDVSEEE